MATPIIITTGFEPVLSCSRCQSRRIDVASYYGTGCAETGYREEADMFVCLNCNAASDEPYYELADPAEAAADDAYHAYAEMEVL